MWKRSQILNPTVEEDEDLGGDEVKFVERDVSSSRYQNGHVGDTTTKGVQGNGFMESAVRVVIKSTAFV